MGKYSSSAKQAPKAMPERPHSIWRGIGCLIMLIVPAISISAGILTVNYGLDHNWPIPYELLGYVRLPDLFYKSQGLTTVFGPLTQINNFYAYAAASLVYMLLIGGVMSSVYAFMYRVVGPSQFGPQDAPPPSRKVKKYKR